LLQWENCMYLSSRGAGYPVLFIHGMPTSGQLWTRVIDKLRGKFSSGHFIPSNKPEVVAAELLRVFEIGAGA
jgi:hypothetical protein